MKKTELKIKGMHCASCVAVINKALSKSKGVKEATVNFSTTKASISFDEKKTSEKKLINVIKNRGFDASRSVSDVKQQEKSEKQEITSIRNKFLISL